MLDNFTQKQKKVIIIVLIIIGAGLIFFMYNKNTVNTDVVEENILVSNNLQNNSSKDETEEEKIVIHVTGSVKKPGIVRLKEGSRIEDAIDAAGGLTENADITKVNLAYILEDGTKIKIPCVTDENIEEEEILSQDSGENVVEKENTSLNSKEKNVNINKASVSELQSLPGIGASLAERIVEYRKQNGRFSSIEDIKNVNGIGDSKFENIRDLIVVK